LVLDPTDVEGGPPTPPSHESSARAFLPETTKVLLSGQVADRLSLCEAKANVPSVVVTVNEPESPVWTFKHWVPPFVTVKSSIWPAERGSMTGLSKVITWPLAYVQVLPSALSVPVVVESGRHTLVAETVVL
jgi:hypothetical protein